MHGCTNQRCKRLYAEPWKRRTSLVKIWCTCAITANLDHRYLSDRWRRFMRRSANQTKGPKKAFSADDTLDEFACTESTSRDSRKLRRSLKRRSVQDESSKCDRSHRIELCVKLRRWKPERYAFTRLIILSVVMRASGRRERGKIYRVPRKREIVHSTCVRYSIESIRWPRIVAVVYFRASIKKGDALFSSVTAAPFTLYLLYIRSYSVIFVEFTTTDASRVMFSKLDPSRSRTRGRVNCIKREERKKERGKEEDARLSTFEC